jgi:hypothetical protein
LAPLETADFDTAWAWVPRPGIVVTELEIREDPVLKPLFEGALETIRLIGDSEIEFLSRPRTRRNPVGCIYWVTPCDQQVLFCSKRAGPTTTEPCPE